MDRLSLPASIVISSLLLAAAYIGYREYEHRRDFDEGMEFLHGLDKSISKDSVWVSQPSVDPRIEAERRAVTQVDRARRRLADNQRCMGGVVVTVAGTVYTQTGEHCSGGYANVPLR
jgi:hypothetical protein